MSRFEEAVATLLKNGCTTENGLRVQYAKVVAGEDYTTVNITCDRKLRRYLRDDDDNYQLSESYTVPILVSSVVRCLRETDLAGIASHIEKHPSCLELLLPGTKIDVVLQDVKANATYSDPFSEKNPEKENEEDYDRLFYHLTKFEPCDKSKKVVEKIEDKMLGF